MSDRPTIFVSYSHEDEDWKDLVVGHLQVAERQGVFSVWDDRRIGGGGAWREEIDQALEAAEIGVLLISRHFLNSSFIMDHEVRVLLERRKREGLRLLIWHDLDVMPLPPLSCSESEKVQMDLVNKPKVTGKRVSDSRGKH
jgi:hypothetical protein